MQVVLRGSGGAGVGQFVIPMEPTALLVFTVLPGCRRSGRQVAALLLGDVGLWAVDRLHVLPEGAGVGVALGAAGDLADIRFLWEGMKTGGHADH